MRIPNIKLPMSEIEIMKTSNICSVTIVVKPESIKPPVPLLVAEELLKQRQTVLTKNILKQTTR